ncbi:hypothetical protein [uncultured Xylophilus sp.]|uniref:hypothetical protein n=1 Tax=uncultured Xylophilus sp. TaxID=296832 RepID=UPI0025FBEAEB|nr:hypothetical protein [uncultured Xylophilus sp.]
MKPAFDVIRLVAVTMFLGLAMLVLQSMLDGQPDELQAEQDVQDEVAAQAAERIAAAGRPRHPSADLPARRAHPSTVVAAAGERR